jgi:CRP-like cAMP-binding protein
MALIFLDCHQAVKGGLFQLTRGGIKTYNGSQKQKPWSLKIMELSETGEVLRGSKFFSDLAAVDIERLADICHTASYGAGETIFRQGDFGEHLYVIARGRVFLERTVDMGGRKGRVVIEALGRGRTLGCWSTLLAEPHVLMSTATCQESTDVVVVRGAELRAMMTENTEFGFSVLERLCFLLRERIQAAYGALEKF